MAFNYHIYGNDKSNTILVDTLRRTQKIIYKSTKIVHHHNTNTY